MNGLAWNRDANYVCHESGHILKKSGKGYLKEHVDKDGYLRVVTTCKGKTLNLLVHRVIYEAFVGPIPPGWTVDHIDDDKTNNHYKNLQVLTAEDNAIKGNAKHWLVVNPEGQLVEVYNLRQFCRDNGLHQSHLYRVIKGHPKYKAHKGWRKHNGT
ncbi:HNH endonuclease [Pseudomonas phage GP100]|nr:HNH endonuclease [Pseudomonas phage GP100]